MTELERQYLQIIAKFTDKIKKVISEDNWEDLNDILKHRQACLEDFFSQLPPLELSSEVRRTIKNIQAEDAISLDVLKVKKQELEKQYLSLKQGRKSVKAYHG